MYLLLHKLLIIATKSEISLVLFERTDSLSRSRSLCNTQQSLCKDFLVKARQHQQHIFLSLFSIKINTINSRVILYIYCTCKNIKAHRNTYKETCTMLRDHFITCCGGFCCCYLKQMSSRHTLSRLYAFVSIIFLYTHDQRVAVV